MSNASRGKMVGYWVATALAGLAFIAGGLFDAARTADVRAIMSHLGYPAYFAAILGVWKALGGVAIVVPGLPRVKEWAYAGMVFDLTGAVISHVTVGDPPRAWLTPIGLLVVVVVSWALRPQSRRLGDLAGAPRKAGAATHALAA